MILFRNALFFQLPSPCLEIPVWELANTLAPFRLKEPGAVATASVGFVPPAGAEGEHLIIRPGNGDQLLLCVGTWRRLLPTSAVNAEVAKHVAAHTATHGRAPGFRERKRIREDVIFTMLPGAPLVPGRTLAYIDIERRVLVVDTATRKAGEQVVAALREALGTFGAVPLDPLEPPRAILTHWLREADGVPTGWMIGDDAVLKDPVERGAIVRITRGDLASDEVRGHLTAGMQVARLAVATEDYSLEVGDDVVLRKLHAFGVLAEEAGDDETHESIENELATRCAITCCVIGEAFEMLVREFKIEPRT